MAQLKKIAKPFVLLCEGQHDSEFFTHLIKARRVPDVFEISSANYVLGIHHGGNTKFTEALDELVSLSGFPQVQKVLIIADNDLDPVAAFDYVVGQINATADIVFPTLHRYEAPTDAQIKAGFNPAIVILMLPWTGINGSLDSMCFTAAANQAPIVSSCVDNFAHCTGSDIWSLTKLSKMKLRSLLSASWQDNPYISPAYVWSENTNLVPLSDRVFDDVADFLNNFPTM